MNKKSIIADSILGTLFIISLILLFRAVTFLGNFSLLDPIGDALSDVEVTDLVFSEIRQNPEIDKNLILVNIGELSRREIAKELEIINQYEPAVVAIDSYFWRPKEDTLSDMMLRKALMGIENLVMVSKLEYDRATGKYDKIRYTHESFNVGKTGFANLETNALSQYQYKVCRTFPPKMTIDGRQEKAFSVVVSEMIDKEKADAFLARGNDYEIINFRGNVMDYGQTRYGGRFIALDVEDVLQRKFTPDLIKDKIVMFGYMGKNFDDKSWEDKFFTPLNVRYAGRSNPDMFGVVIHANIISMILNQDLIGQQSRMAGSMMALVICFLTVVFFTWIYRRLPLWYDGLTKVIQLMLVLVLMTASVFIFHWFDYKVRMTLAIIMVLLAGDSLEVTYGVLKNLFSKIKRKFVFGMSKPRHWKNDKQEAPVRVSHKY